MNTTPEARKARTPPEAGSDREDAAAGSEAQAPEGKAPSQAQLAQARRIAERHGLQVNTDAEAVAALRARGIDPFERETRIQIVPGTLRRTDGAAVPAVVPPPKPPRPSNEDRAEGIVRIQRDIARRRRRRLALLVVRLAVFVFLPTLLAGIYYYAIATPLYATNSEFVIQQADAATPQGGAGLFANGGGGTAQQDSISVQSYLLSRDALARLDADLGFVRHFSDPEIDPLRRLKPDTTREAAYRLYQRMVRIGFDPTEGVVRMEVLAADPELSAAFSSALIGYAEERVDNLTARLRGDQMAGAEASFAQAETRMLDAQARVVSLQETLGVVSAEAEVSNSYAQIGDIEAQLREARLALDRLLANVRPQQSRVDLARRSVERLEAELARLRAGLSESATDGASLARATAELQVAQQDLMTRQLLLQQSAQQLEAARIEANRQVRYLSTPVPPTPPDEATYPRAFENTVLAFLIFAGVYLMLSLTGAILKEQVVG